MADFELTDYGIEALVSGALSLVALIILSTIQTYGALMAFLFGLGMIIASILNLVGIWMERSERPLFWAMLLGFGIIFEFGSVTGIAAILPYCVIIDVVVILISAIAAAIMPISSTLASWLGN